MTVFLILAWVALVILALVIVHILKVQKREFNRVWRIFESLSNSNESTIKSLSGQNTINSLMTDNIDSLNARYIEQIKINEDIIYLLNFNMKGVKEITEAFCVQTGFCPQCRQSIITGDHLTTCNYIIDKVNGFGTHGN